MQRGIFPSTINTILLLAVVVSSTITAALKLEVNIFTYVGIVSMILFSLNSIKMKLERPQYVVFMSMLFVLHFIFVPEKLTTVIILISVVLFYETIKITRYNEKFILFILYAFFVISVLFTLPELMHSLLTSHDNREELYKGFFLNSNTNAALSLMVVYSAILFLRKSFLRNMLMLIAAIAIFATGSRNALLSMILSSGFYFLLGTKYAKFTFVSYLSFLLCALLYMVLFEANSDADFTFMGKGATSAGRAEQILLVMAFFPVNLLGNGKDVIDTFVTDDSYFSIHNFYVNSLYSLGILTLLSYFYFVYNLFTNFASKAAKSILLAINIYFFFDPGTCFYFSYINFIPTMLILMKYNQEKKSKIL